MINKACFFSNVFFFFWYFCIFQISLFPCASIHQGYDRLSDESRGQHFLLIRERRCEDKDAWLTGLIRFDETLLALRCI